MKKEVTFDDVFATVDMMTIQGGNFVKQLGQLLLVSDSANVNRIIDTWPDLWTKYHKLAKRAQ